MFYVVVFEGFRYTASSVKVAHRVSQESKEGTRRPERAFSSRRQVVLLDQEITKALAALHQKVKSFILQVSDFVQVELLGKQEAFRVLKRALNFAPREAPARTAQTRHVSGLLPLRIASGMPSRTFEARRLLRQGLDPQRALSPELSAHLQTFSKCRLTFTSSRSGRRRIPARRGRRSNRSAATSTTRSAPPSQVISTSRMLHQRTFWWTTQRKPRSANLARASRNSKSKAIISGTFH